MIWFQSHLVANNHAFEPTLHSSFEPHHPVWTINYTFLKECLFVFKLVLKAQLDAA